MKAETRRFQFSLRALLIFVSVAALLMGLLLTPLARIDRKTCDRIRPGMTEAEAVAIVGAPCGWYDGVGGISTNSPGWKGYKPNWIGLGGEIIVDLDDAGRVTNATHYPGTVLNWSLPAFLWDRLTRRGQPVARLSVPVRAGVFAIGVALATLLVGVMVVRAGGVNAAANHGGVGLLVGFVAGGILFWDIAFRDMATLACVLSTPILGALIGVFVGLARKKVTGTKFGDPGGSGKALAGPAAT